MISKIISKVREIIEEGKKLTFPKKGDVYLTSLNIIFIVFFASLVILFTDFVISNVIKILFGLGK